MQAVKHADDYVMGINWHGMGREKKRYRRDFDGSTPAGKNPGL
jgi:hypothetical protein